MPAKNKGKSKAGNIIQPDTDAFPVGRGYWDYFIRHLTEDGYIERVVLFPVLSPDSKWIKITDGDMVTPKGIDFLENNPTMNKEKEFLKTLKETIPGL